MLSKVLFLSLILIVFFAFEEVLSYAAAQLHNNVQAPASQPAATDLIFVQTWPPSFCKNQLQGCQNPARFTIHGLWPRQSGSPGPFKMSDTVLNTYKTELMKYWPDLRTNNFQKSKSFWIHEYDSHGVYSSFDPESYIKKTLEFGQFNDTRGWLAKENIVPDANKQYATSKIVAAIYRQTGFIPDLQCVVDLQTRKCYLLEVRQCLEEKIQNSKNCSGKVGQCATQIYYPPF